MKSVPQQWHVAWGRIVSFIDRSLSLCIFGIYCYIHMMSMLDVHKHVFFVFDVDRVLGDKSLLLRHGQRARVVWWDPLCFV